MYVHVDDISGDFITESSPAAKKILPLSLHVPKNSFKLKVLCINHSKS